MVPSRLHNHIPKFALILNDIALSQPPNSLWTGARQRIAFCSVKHLWCFPLMYFHSLTDTLGDMQYLPGILLQCRNWSHFRNSNTAHIKEMLLLPASKFLPLGQGLLVSTAHGTLKSEGALCWKKSGKHFFTVIYQI